MLKTGSNLSEVRIDGSLENLRRDLDAFRIFGLDAAEVGVHGTDVIRNGRLVEGRCREIEELLGQYPFAYSVHAPNPLNLMDCEEPEIHNQVMRASLEFTSRIGARAMVYHPGRYQAEETFGVFGKLAVPVSEQQRLRDLEARLLQDFADEFPEVVIAMENARPYRYHSPYCYAEKVSELKEQIERIGRDNVGVTLDFGHLHMAAQYYGFDEEEAVTSVAGFVHHCHVHDNFGGAVFHSQKQQTHQIPLGQGDSHMPVGWGDIDFTRLFNCFIDQYDGLLIVELRGRYFEHTAESAANLDRITRALLAA